MTASLHIPSLVFTSTVEPTWSTEKPNSALRLQQQQQQQLLYQQFDCVYFKSSGLTRTLSTHGGIFSFITMVVSDKLRQGKLYISPQEKRHSARFPQKFNQWQLKTRWFSLKTNKRIIHKALQSHSQFNEISILHLLDQYTVRMLEHDWTNTSGLLLLINQENTQELWFVIRTIKTCHRHEYHSNLGLFMIS